MPDFKRLQKTFVENLEELKRQKHMSTTVPEPFHFHNPKPTARMRRYLDAENQLINPTLKKIRAHSAAAINGAGSTSPTKERDDRENPAITSKFSAYVTQRRKKQESKKLEEQVKFQDEVQRFFKQNRLA